MTDRDRETDRERQIIGKDIQGQRKTGRRQRQIKTDRERETERDRQRQTDRDRERRTRTEKDGEKTETKYCIDSTDRQTDRQRQIETDRLRQRKRQTDRDRETDRQRQIETDRCLQAADRNRERRTRTEKDGLAWARRASVICCCEGAILRPVGPARETAVESFLTVSEGNVRHPACGSCRLG